jgi:hypothetical protein
LRALVRTDAGLVPRLLLAVIVGPEVVAALDLELSERVDDPRRSEPAMSGLIRARLPRSGAPC